MATFQFERVQSGNVLLKDGATIIQSFPQMSYLTADPRNSDVIKIDSDPGTAQENQMFEFKASTITVPTHTDRNDLLRQLAEDFFRDNNTVPFAARLKDSGGAFDMRVNGSIGSPIDFFVEADSLVDIFITSLYIVIADKNVTLEKFGNIPELPNGSLIFLEKDSVDEPIHALDEPLKRNFDYIFVSNAKVPIGGGSDSFKLSGFSGNLSGYMAVFDFTQMVPGKGIKLRAGSSDKIIHRVRDNTSGVDEFHGSVSGYKSL